MNNFRHILLCSFLVVMIWLIPQKAHAYIDPGTGSYIFQIAIAFFVGLLFSIKLFGRSIKTFFSKVFVRARKDESGDE